MSNNINNLHNSMPMNHNNNAKNAMDRKLSKQERHVSDTFIRKTTKKNLLKFFFI